jgi:hypothetical protein
MPETYYDSLHSYVCNAYMDIFGEHRKVYDMNLIPTGGGQSLIDPIIVGKTAFAQPGPQFVTDFDHIMPLSFKWTANSGVQGSFLVVGFQREVNPGVNPDWVTPIGFSGTVNNTGNGSGGGIIGDIVKSPHHGLDDWGVVSFLATKGDCINLHGGTPVGNVKPAWETIRYYHDADSKYANFDFEDIVTKVGRVTFDPTPANTSIVVVDSNGDVSFIGIGTSGQYLQSNGNGTYTWVTPSAASGGGFYTVNGYRTFKTATAGWFNLMGDSAITSIQDARANFVAPEACTAAEYSFYSQGAASATFRVYKNGSIAASLSITLSAGANTSSFSGQWTSISAGDRLSFQLSPLAGINGVFMTVKLEV